MNKLARYYWIAKGVGWDNVPRRLLQAVRLRNGYLTKNLDPSRFSDHAFRAACCDMSESAMVPVFRRNLRASFPQIIATSQASQEDLKHVTNEATRQQSLLEPCRKAMTGDYLFFGHWHGKIGWPPDFNLDPVNGHRYPTNVHSLHTAKSGPPRDDVKFVWEPSRLTMSYYFARAYAHTGDETWSRAFWTMFDAWIEQNPPMMSAAWGCGQESAFRLMALLFGASVTLASPAATADRLRKLIGFTWQTGQLIDVNINYALSQKNNHGISESMGLLTAGVMLTGLCSRAERWRSRGVQCLASEIKRQIYDDGSFVQHSMNYHRVMLDDVLWGMTVSDSNGIPLPAVVSDRFRRAVAWLAEMIDLQSGRVPNYGPNDGSQVLPLSCCDYLDYRPVLQAAWFRLNGTRFFQPGPWDEKMLWLFGSNSLKAEVLPSKRAATFAAPDGGYYVMRGEASWGMIRCHTYRDRPAESDMLHFDLWQNGKNILRDGGSYRYYSTEPVASFFCGTAAHNTVQIDEVDQMVQGPRFLKFHWTKSQLLKWEVNSSKRSFFSARHFGYRRLPGYITLRRSIERNGDVWRVTDEVFACKSVEHLIASRFRLAPGNWATDETAEVIAWCLDGYSVAWKKVPGLRAIIVQGSVSPAEGWESLHYGEKTPAPTLVITGNLLLTTAPLALEYLFAPLECRAHF